MTTVRVLRIAQIINAVMIVPIFCLGMMVSLSGGGVTPAYQQIGGQLMLMAFAAPLVCVALAEGVYRLAQQPLIGAVVCLIPFGVWVWLCIRLENATGFFNW
ncbi:MAG: hypothetical protein AAF787_04460 [Chloroflexota bacterium]